MNRSVCNRRLRAICQAYDVERVRTPLARAWIKLIARCLYNLEKENAKREQ
jgi:hypothetical protein